MQEWALFQIVQTWSRDEKFTIARKLTQIKFCNPFGEK